MEEKKINSKENVAKTNQSNSQGQTQISYEQLNNIAHQLSEQNMQMRRQIQAMDMTNFFKRLDYLFKVIEFAHMFSDEFADKCAQEIETSLALPPQETAEDTQGNAQTKEGSEGEAGKEEMHEEDDGSNDVPAPAEKDSVDEEGYEEDSEEESEEEDNELVGLLS